MNERRIEEENDPIDGSKPNPRDTIKETQARRIINKFGGARNLARCLSASGRHRDPASIFRWTYLKKHGGTGGLIPTHAWPDIMKAARDHGIMITGDDLDPRPRLVKKIKRHDVPKVDRKKKGEGRIPPQKLSAPTVVPQSTGTFTTTATTEPTSEDIFE